MQGLCGIAHILSPSYMSIKVSQVIKKDRGALIFSISVAATVHELSLEHKLFFYSLKVLSFSFSRKFYVT